MQIAIDAVNNLHPLADGYTLNPTWYMPGCNDAESLKAVVKASLARLLVSHVHLPKKHKLLSSIINHHFTKGINLLLS